MYTQGKAYTQRNRNLYKHCSYKKIAGDDFLLLFGHVI